MPEDLANLGLALPVWPMLSVNVHGSLLYVPAVVCEVPLRLRPLRVSPLAPVAVPVAVCAFPS